MGKLIVCYMTQTSWNPNNKKLNYIYIFCIALVSYDNVVRKLFVAD